MQKLFCLFILFITLCKTKSTAQTDLYEKHWFVKGNDSLPYRLLLPKNYDHSKRYPFILFLHGSGERGSDNEAQLKHGSSLFLRDSIREQYPAFIIFPQCAENSFWSNVEFKTDPVSKSRTFIFKTGGTPTTAMMLLENLLDDMGATYHIDKRHRYVMGLSMGGMGAFELVNRKRKYFAAAMPICGGANTATAKKMTKTNWWIFHGAKDDVVPPHLSEEMADALTKAGANARLTIYPNTNHNSWDNAFAEKDLLHWLFSQQKK